MAHRSTSTVFFHAKLLRRNLTPAESRLWKRIRGHRLAGIGFRRQHPIGPFVADFCAPRSKLIIELDGGHHAFQKENDEARTVFIQQHGYAVLRFWNSEVMNNLDGVISEIEKILIERQEGE